VTYSIVNAWPLKTVGLALRFAVKISVDGTARMHGAIRVRDDAGRHRLVANGGAQTACADSDGDGTAGLVRLAAEFRDAKTGALVPMVLSPTEHDIDAGGTYAVSLRIGEETVTGEVFVKLPGRVPGRH
jgi:hypothetical protein